MADVIRTGMKPTLVATTSSRIRDLLIKDGQLVFVQDLGRIAFDYNGKRVFYNQITQLNTDAERLDLESPLNGYYFVFDTACLWSYQDEWIQITEKPQDIIYIGVELPQLGQANKLYVDTDDREISVWDEENGEYITVANYTQEATTEDIENIFQLNYN